MGKWSIYIRSQTKNKRSLNIYFGFLQNVEQLRIIGF